MDKNKELDTAELRMGFLKRYGWKGSIVLVLSLLAPYAGSLLDQYMSNRLITAVHKEFIPLNLRIDRTNEILLKSRAIAIEAHGKKVLSAKDIDYIARIAVKAQSIYKVQQIRELLDDNAVPVGGVEFDRYVVRMESRIKRILVSNSMVYVRALNRYQHKSIGNVGDYIWNNFPMEEFLTIVYDLALNTDCDNNDIKSDDIMTYMLEIQNSFFTEMHHKMKKEI